MTRGKSAFPLGSKQARKKTSSRVVRDPVERQIEAKKQTTLHLLLKAARLANEYAIRRAPAVASDQAGASGTLVHLGPAHLALFPHIPWEGIRLTELASRLGVSKQAVGQLVDDLVATGTLSRVSDEADKRAKRIVFTSQGKHQLRRGLDLLARVQSEFEAAIGKQTISRLHAPLVRLVAFLETADGAGSSGDADCDSAP